jgi:hypothetical protein
MLNEFSTSENGFLAYAVQVEEDRLNRKILEMHRQLATEREQADLRDSIAGILQSGDIRERDDFLTRQADAQAGRVLQDRQGNWVRVQQYILRPDAQTVQVLNVNLRGSGDHAGLTTMDWKTTFMGEGYPKDHDLRALPWDHWLSTQGPWKPVEPHSRYVVTTEQAPELDNMSVTFTAPSGDYLTQERAFLAKHSYPVNHQEIDNETLSLSSGDVYTYTNNWTNAGPNEYWISPAGADPAYKAASDHNPMGFHYMRRYGPLNENPGQDMIEPFIEANLFVVGDGTVGHAGVSPQDYSDVSIQDIWAALNINNGQSYIGNNNLEINLRGLQTGVLDHEIDLVYIPMSRMLWRNDRVLP